MSKAARGKGAKGNAEEKENLFGRSQSYRVATTPLVDDGGKGKDGAKPAKASKSKSKKKAKKENLEDLKKELEIVRRALHC